MKMPSIGFDKQYRVYAKKIQNNHVNEPSLIGTYDGYNKQNAISKAMNAPENSGFYQLNSFFAVCSVWKFEEVN